MRWDEVMQILTFLVQKLRTTALGTLLNCKSWNQSYPWCPLNLNMNRMFINRGKSGFDDGVLTIFWEA